MAIYAFGDLEPEIDPAAFVHPDAIVIGAVSLGAGTSIWPTAVLRADEGRIVIGADTSIQDGTVLHTTPATPTLIGRGCVVGHNAHLEGCSVGDHCLIGSGSVVLNGAVVESGAAVGAGAVVTQGKTVPSGMIALGVPAQLRPAPEMPEYVGHGVRHYVELAKRYRSELRRLA